MAIRPQTQLPAGRDLSVSNGRGFGANDFRNAYRSIRANYRARFEPQIAELRVKYANPARQDPRLEQVLEATFAGM